MKPTTLPQTSMAESAVRDREKAVHPGTSVRVSSGGSSSQSFLRRGALSTWWALTALYMQSGALQWFRWRIKRWPLQRSLTSGSKFPQTGFLGVNAVSSLMWFRSVLTGMRRIRNSGAECWGNCATLQVPPACPCVSTLRGCPNCRQNSPLTHTLSLYLRHTHTHTEETSY